MPGQVHLLSFYPVKIGSILQKTHIFPLFSKYFDLHCVFISNTRDDRERSIPGYSTTSFSSRELRKLRYDFIFGIPCSIFRMTLLISERFQGRHMYDEEGVKTNTNTHCTTN